MKLNPELCEPGTTPVLMFHNIGSLAHARGLTVLPWVFERYLVELSKARLGSMTMEQLTDNWGSEAIEPHRHAVLTFDDAYIGVHRYAIPAMERRGWRGTIYVVTDLIGGHSAWMAKGAGELSLMGWPEIEDARRRGFEIGCHTKSHRCLTRLSKGQVREEICDSKKALEDKLGIEIHSFAYPFGIYNEVVREMVREAGFRSAVSVRSGKVTWESDRLALPRIAISSWRLSPKKLLRRVASAPPA